METRRRPLAMFLLGAASALLGAGCEQTVNCENLCRRTLACEVEFTAPDDPNGQQVDDGERSELESCVLGCESSTLVTIESASCVDAVDTDDAASCQDDVLACFDVDEGGTPR